MKLIDFEKFLLDNEFKRHISVYGGGNNIENLQLLCQPCNSKKSAKLIDEVYKIFDAINPKRP